MLSREGHADNSAAAVTVPIASKKIRRRVGVLSDQAGWHNSSPHRRAPEHQDQKHTLATQAVKQGAAIKHRLPVMLGPTRSE